MVTRQQALMAGVSSSSWHHRTAVEEWRTPHPGVAVAPWAADGPRTAASAAAWAVAPLGAATADTALALHGARVAFPDPPVLVLPHQRRGAGPRGVDVVRSRTLVPADVSRVDGIPTVSIHRALADLAVRASVPLLRERLIDLRQRRLLELDALRTYLVGLAGMTGRPRLLRATDEVDAHGADSVFTAMVMDALLGASLEPDPVPCEVVTRRRVLHPDITFAARRVAIECDSLGFHADQRALDTDARKHNAYRLAGWTVLRVTWLRFHRDRAGFVTEVRQALGSGH